MSRDILKAALSTKGGIPTALNLLQTSIGELSALLTKGKITSVSLVEAYIANIERNNTQNLCLRAIIQVAPIDSVLRIAKSLDEEREKGTIRGPLHGIPILLKDSISTDPELGMDTSAGSTALQQSVVSGDAEVVKRLRAAGAIILAKTNLTELSSYQGLGMPVGWSAVGGQCSSAYLEGGDLTGTSAGSAVGVCAGFGAAAIGVETFGSIVGPASRSALFGIKPTNGLVPVEGVVPISSERDCIGPIGFTVADVAAVLDAMTDNDGKYLRAANLPRLQGIKLGLVRQHFIDDSPVRWIRPGSFPDQCVPVALAAMDKMRDAGAEIEDVNMDLDIADMNNFLENQWAVFSSDFREDFTKHLEQLKESPVRSIEELVKWNEDHAAIELPPNAPNQQRLIAALTAPARSSEEYQQAKAVCMEMGGTKGFDYIFDKHDLDAAVFALDLGYVHMLQGPRGYPSGVAPLGVYENGVPFGLLFVVRPHQEEKLISILSRFEEIMPKRTIPKSL